MAKSYRRASLTAVVVAAAVAVPITLGAGTGTATVTGAAGSAAAATAAAATTPPLPRPGGGPVAIHTAVSYSGDSTRLLDPRTGRYVALPYGRVQLSPDLRTVAVEDPADGRIGLARREAVLANPASVRWTSLPPGSFTGWSPDGRALLTTTLEKETWTFTVHRLDVRDGRLRSTPVTAIDCDVCTAGWAADSRRYVIRETGPDPDVPVGPLRYLNPDGTAGPLVGTAGHIWDERTYSPSRRYVVVEPSRPFVGDPLPWQLPKVFDLLTRTAVFTVDTRDPVVGWYDERRIVRIASGTAALEVVDIHSGVVSRRVAIDGLLGHEFGLGSSAELRGRARELGF